MERNTNQRRAIRQVFLDLGRPLSPQEVLTGAQTAVGGLGMATVYRNIKALVAERWLAIVDLPGQPARYEVAGKDHHHHFQCHGCGKVFDIPGCVEHVHARVPAGFQVDYHEVVIHGLCEPCRKPGKPRKSSTASHAGHRH